MKLNSLFLLLLAFIIFSCSDESDPVIENETLVSSNERFGYSRSDIVNLFAFTGITSINDYLIHDVKIYDIEYKTTYLGQEITASGIVTFPETTDEVPILSFQHGTMVAHNDAPTLNSDYSLLSNLASSGYIFIVPDLIGFGSSNTVLHPYYHQELTATAIVDMVKATVELAREEGYNFDGNLFLAGYSEGGFATMAAHKYLEDHPQEGINLIASAPASGGYDVKGMQEYFFSLETYHQPFYLAYVAMSYLSVYSDWSITLGDIFNEPYATDIPGYFDGSFSNSQINGKLTENVSDLLTTNFINNIDTDPIYKDIVDAFEENSLDNWVPKIKMTLYHGTADITVPYQNSVDSYENMKSLGASTDLVKFVPIEGGTHSTGFFPYLEGFIQEFDDLK